MTPLLLVSLAAAAPPADPPRHRIEAADHRRVTATTTYEVRAPGFAAAKWVAFVPQAPELPSQTKVKTTVTPNGQAVADKSEPARPLVRVTVNNPKPDQQSKLVLKAEYSAVLRSRKLVPLADGEKPPAVKPLSAAERKAYTAADRFFDFDETPVRDWLAKHDLKLKSEESPIAFAARVVDVIRSGYEYKFDRDDPRKMASVVCRKAATDCGGMANLFAAAMRANGVPARVLVGRLAEPRAAGSKSGELEHNRPHARPEFFAAGVGWVPAEPAYANRDKGRPAADFVGTDPGDLLVLHVGYDLLLPLPEKPERAELLQLSPYVRGYGRGRFEPELGPTGWEVTVTPVK